jgi:hypothetical protein
MSNAFPAMCDGVSFLCWIVDERGYVLHARDSRCSSGGAACVGNSLSSLRPLVASVLISSGTFQTVAVRGSSSVMYTVYRDRSIARKTVRLVATHDGTTLSAEQQLEVNVFPATGTTATVVVLSGAGMQVSPKMLL